jgi:hypothetical protein
VLAQSHARIHKERAMRRRKLNWLWARPKQIAAMKLTREELLMKLGAARSKARAARRLIDVEVGYIAGRKLSALAIFQATRKRGSSVPSSNSPGRRAG